MKKIENLSKERNPNSNILGYFRKTKIGTKNPKFIQNWDHEK